MRIPLTLALVSLPFAVPVLGQSEATGWHLFGTNDLLVENYDTTGDRSASSFKFDGTFFTDRLNLDLGWADELSHQFKLRTELLGADNDYLAEDGAVLEAFTLGFENGEVAVPFRVEFGDLFGDFSSRTLRRSVRGASFELQPQTEQSDHSLVLLASTGQPAWSKTFGDQGDDLTFSGASYLFSPRSGRASFAASFVETRANLSATIPSAPARQTDQSIASLAGHAKWKNGVKLAGEAAYLETSANGSADLSDTSFLFELSRGGARAFAWKLRAEDNGKSFLPLTGVSVLANRRLVALDLRRNFQGRGYLSINLQGIQDRVAGALPRLETKIAGVTYQGQPAERRPSFQLRLAGDWNSVEAENKSVDQVYRHYGLELSDLFGGRFELRCRGDFWDVNDKVIAVATRRSLDESVTFGLRAGSSFVIRLGGIVRRQWRGADFESESPVIDLDLTRGSHRLSLHYSLLDQDFVARTTRDLEYTSQHLLYSFERGAHLVSLEAGRDLREPEGAQETESLRFALRYRFSFDQHWGI